MDNNKKVLAKANDILNKYHENEAKKESSNDSLIHKLQSEFSINKMDTLVLDYRNHKAILSVISTNKSESFKYDISDKEYLEGVVQDFLGVDLNNTYVSSITNTIEGTNARIYTILPPVSKYPLVTISTIKPIPDKEHLFENDPIFRTTLSFR